MQIIFRPNQDRPPKKFKPPLEKVDTPAAKESADSDVEETSTAKVGFIVEENGAKEQEQLQHAEEIIEENIMEAVAVEKNHTDYHGCKPGCPDNNPGYPEYPSYPDYPGCKPGWPDHNPDYPEYPSHPDYPNPNPPDNGPDHVCRPYPYPGKYYPLQCLGYAYIPWQTYQRQFQPSEALEKGTLFPELYSPYFSERRPPVIPRPYCNMWQCPNMMRKKKR